MRKRILQFTVFTKPVSINKAYRSIVVRRAGKFLPSAILTSQGKAFKEIVGRNALVAMRSYGYALIEGPFSLVVDYHFDPRAEGDVTNYDKALIDGMKGIVFKDDIYLGRNKYPEYLDAGIFFEATFRKWFDSQDPRTEIKVIFYLP
jgi:hypothetical protein